MIRINLLPIRAAKRREALQRHLVVFTVGFVVLLSVGMVSYQGRASTLGDLRVENGRIKSEIENLKKIIGEVDEYKRQQELLEKKLEVIRNLKANKTGPVHMLDELAIRIPEKLWLSELDQVEHKLTIEGVSINNEVIATFMSRLEESDYFAEVYLVAIEANEQEDISLKEFTLTSKLTVPGTETSVKDSERPG